MKTVRELADIIKVSKVSIYKALKRDNIKEHVITHDNITCIDETGEQLLIDLFLINSKVNSTIKSAENGLTIEILMKQLEIKDKQIEELTATIKSLSESINAANQTKLAETIIDTQSSLPPASEKVSLWDKIFKRKN